MKKLLFVLSGIVAAYLALAAIYNSWDFITGLEPRECVSRIALYLIIMSLFSSLADFIFEEY